MWRFHVAQNETFFGLAARGSRQLKFNRAVSSHVILPYHSVSAESRSKFLEHLVAKSPGKLRTIEAIKRNHRHRNACSGFRGGLRYYFLAGAEAGAWQPLLNLAIRLGPGLTWNLALIKIGQNYAGDAVGFVRQVPAEETLSNLSRGGRGSQIPW